MPPSDQDPGAQWPREAWSRAIWADDTLTSTARLVALCYADHAGAEDIAWVAGPRLRQRTALSRDATNRALRVLEQAGWLQVAERARQHYSTRYRLTIPQRSVSRTAEPVGNPGSVPPAVPLDRPSVPSPDISVPSERISVPGGGNERTSTTNNHISSREDDDVNPSREQQRKHAAAELRRRFETAHPGRAKEALQAARKQHPDVRDIVSYFTAWTDEDIAAIRLPAPPPPPPCPDCNGSGWIEDADRNPIRKCTHQNRTTT